MRYNDRMKKIDANTLPDDVEALKAMLLEQQAEKARLQQESDLKNGSLS
jgi:hypothetical protein